MRFKGSSQQSRQKTFVFKSFYSSLVQGKLINNDMTERIRKSEDSILERYACTIKVLLATLTAKFHLNPFHLQSSFIQNNFSPNYIR